MSGWAIGEHRQLLQRRAQLRRLVGLAHAREHVLVLAQPHLGVQRLAQPPQDSVRARPAARVEFREEQLDARPEVARPLDHQVHFKRAVPQRRRGLFGALPLHDWLDAS